MREPPQALEVERVGDAIERGAPDAEPLVPRFGFAGEKFADAGAIVGKGIDASETLGDQLLLKQEAASGVTTKT
jgi:hypothetical protein